VGKKVKEKEKKVKENEKNYSFEISPQLSTNKLFPA
jgi:hypothetical protein